MKLTGLIGYPLAHSHSPALFQEFFHEAGVHDWDYCLFPIREIEELFPLLDRFPNLIGLNVTIPHKQSIIPFCNTLSDDARAVNAVNTVKIRRPAPGEYFLSGYNTDIHGFEYMVQEHLKPGVKAIILGAGGSTQAVKFVLNRHQIPYVIVSRVPGKGDLVYSDLNEQILSEHQLIINTTPLGMYPRMVDKPPIPYELITPGHICADLSYNPENTQFLQECRQRGATTINGLTMLRHQARIAWEIFQNENL